MRSSMKLKENELRKVERNLWKKKFFKSDDI